MVFAAGLGTRLHPLTQSAPKALVELNGRPLLDHVLKRLVRFGVQSIVVNIHHYGEQIMQFLQNEEYGVPVYVSDERGALLDTGGGLRHATKLFSGNQPILLHNVDVFSDVDLNQMLDFHLINKAMATVAVRDRSTSRYLLFDDQHILRGWENIKTGELKFVEANHNLNRLAFSGIHIVNPEILNLIDRNGKFSIIDLYLELSKKYRIQAFQHDESFWMDVGRISHLRELEKRI